MKKPEPCPAPCTHTDLEHKAFDRGVIAGRKGKAIKGCPYKRWNLVEAWGTGHAVGHLDRE